MSYAEHAKREFKAVGYTDEDTGPNKWIQDNVLELLEVFSKQGHSGSSAPVVANMFKTLALFEPLAPIQGTAEEWNQVGETTWQNIRCSHVFKDSIDGQAYDFQGRIFREPNGACFTSRDSRVPVTFPYTPKREYVDVPAER